MAKKKQHGSGAICSVLLKYIHPAKYISEKFKNYSSDERLENCIECGQEIRNVKKKNHVVILFRHDDHDGQDLYAVKRWVKVVTEGAAEHIFRDEEEENPTTDNPNEKEAEGAVIDDNVFRAGGHAEDIALVRAQGLDVDDDNLPAPENIPIATTSNTTDDSHQEIGWGWSGIDHRKQLNISEVRANISGITSDAMEHVSFVRMFFLLFPKSLIETIIEQTNKKLDSPTNMGEFMRWIGIWLLLSTLSGYKRSDFWSMKPIELYEGAPYRLNEFMTLARFESILKALTLTKETAPPYKDRFWEVHEMLQSWNDHMQKKFVPSWVSCLDESMSIWFNRYTCQGWVYCPRKPHPYGNEYHTICCGLSGIMYAMEIVEGKDIHDLARFESILKALTLTKEKPPPFKDRFWEVREMIDCWNDHMQEIFVPSWVSCLDESMSIWFNRYTCPGWVYCPRKPHPYGNEYHTICCGLSGIMYAMEIVEGKDRPKDQPTDSNDRLVGKTGALLLRLCESLYTSGKVVILDSGFCVLKALIALRQKGVFASALIKKRKYWPRYINGDAIATHMASKQVGECDSLRGTLDAVPYDVFCMKEPDYIMKLMSTYGGLTFPKNQRISKRTWKENGETKNITFQYTEPFANHFNYRHAVDDHNNLRHGLPSIESTMLTHNW
eukprot:CAMPEP_0184872744 /NCGR_PEP_ID=MMETSP0580-20130426/41459_1 /TAXON_ID=1118495 /ORGANISM="Dactyliosolen fragilissimus" /LENGTH=665 /DNA_ID=CAMNT_0027375583 /DNA_START=1012 /DNA_END=3007 /DNA_ORIENTATION=+